ncbi:MAG: hypothetical protein IIA05_11645 [Proteobacteria bacterium]|nr:hypothetical protein [Pseudomonadota bacterium]
MAAVARSRLALSRAQRSISGLTSTLLIFRPDRLSNRPAVYRKAAIVGAVSLLQPFEFSKQASTLKYNSEVTAADERRYHSAVRFVLGIRIQCTVQETGKNLIQRSVTGPQIAVTKDTLFARPLHDISYSAQRCTVH